MTTISISTLRISTGMVIFVGIAARLTISDIVIATIAVINSNRFMPVKATMITVSGVRKHPCPAIDIPSHNSLLSSWPAVQAENLVNKDGFAL